ncbi:MAG: hypothetical protein ACRD4Q_13765 [Candidatus Acidiferrales bacterium]
MSSTQVVVQPMLWASTKDIEEVEPVSDKDADVLSELREVLVKHNAVDRFGIMLIHKHFDLAENEQMVEFTDLENRRLTPPAYVGGNGCQYDPDILEVPQRPGCAARGHGGLCLALLL